MPNIPKARSSKRHRRQLARIRWSGRASRFLLALCIVVVVGLWLIWHFTPSTSSPPTAQTPIVYATRSVAELTPATVKRVIDGDTIDVIVNGEPQRVRYIGIDTPERGETGYREATQLNRQLLGTGDIYLEQDVSETDRYERLLRYVYLSDGRMLNEILVAEGWAKAIAYPPDVKYADRFQVAEQAASQAEVGLWTP